MKDTDKKELVDKLRAYRIARSTEFNLFDDISKYSSTAKENAAWALITQLESGDPFKFERISEYNREVLAEGRLGKLYDQALMLAIDANQVEKDENSRKIEALELAIKTV